MKQIHFESIDSTNIYLKNNYKNLDNLTFISADEQTSGKGRSNRKWISEKGKNLMFSLLIKDEKLINNFKSLSISSAYTIIKVLEEYGLKDLSIKWPNDVYVKDKKICGILLESISIEKIEALIVGIGLNVNQKEFVGEYLIEPTSMYKELNKEIDLIKLENKIYKNLLENYNKNNYREILEYDYLKGKQAKAYINNELKDISIIGINEDYSLKIKVDNIEKDIYAGEISFHLGGN